MTGYELYNQWDILSTSQHLK